MDATNVVAFRRRQHDPRPRQHLAPIPTDELTETVNQIIETCDGDPVAALRALVVAYEYAQADIVALQAALDPATPPSSPRDGRRR